MATALTRQNDIQLQDENYFEFLSGLWTGKKPPFSKAVVIRNTNFGKDGRIDYSDIAVLDVETKQLEKRKLQTGDIIIERSGGGPKQPVGRVVYFENNSKENDYSFSNFTSAIRVKNKECFDSRFVFYFLHNYYIEGKTDHLQRRTTGIRNLDYQAYKESVIFPAFYVKEQKAIARVLTTVQEDIARQEELIAKLKELKRSIMQRFFTHGTKGEKTKITEIGEIPESWDVIELGNNFNIQQGKQVSKKNRLGVNQKSFLRTANVFWNRIDLSILDKMNFTEAEEKLFALKKDDLLVCEGGDVGRTAILNEDLINCYYQNHLHRLRSIGQVKPRLLLHWLNYAFEQTNIYFGRANITTIPNLSKSRLFEFLIPMPNKEEQQRIIECVDLINRKVKSNKEKLSTCQNLFKTLLHELMSGERRIKRLHS